MAMTTAMIEQEPMGIIVTTGREAESPVSIWAYMWVEDEGEGASDHWHLHVPVD